MRGTFRACLIAAVGLLSVGLGAAAAQPPPREKDNFTDRTQADFVLSTGELKAKTCTSRNDDGPVPPPPPGATYLDVTFESSGPITSMDPRLNGVLEVKGNALLRAEPDAGPALPDNGFAGLGKAKFRVETSDPERADTHGEVFATVQAIAPDQVLVEGTAIGKAPNPRKSERSTDTDYEGGELTGNFSATAPQTPGSPVVGNIGGASDSPTQDAFFQDGQCQGPPQEFSGL